MTEKLKEYLSINYPNGSRLYKLMQISFYNDYHRSIANDLIHQIYKTDFELSQRLFMSKLCGAVMLSTSQWIRNFDAELSELVNKSKGYDVLCAYFDVLSVKKSEDKFSDLIHGEGYSEKIRNEVKRILNKD